MTSPRDDSSLEADDKDGKESAAGALRDMCQAQGWQESLLTAAFDEQIRIVAKCIHAEQPPARQRQPGQPDARPQAARSRQPNSRRAEDNKVFTNRSRIYRYEREPDKREPIVSPPVSVDPSSLANLDNEPEARASMLMSWYMAGYHTGYYEATKRYKKQAD